MNSNDPNRFYFAPEAPPERLDFTPAVRLVHDFPVADASRIFRKTTLGDHALHYFYSGGGSYELNGRHDPIEPGRVFLVRPGQGYAFQLTAQTPVRMLNVHFDLEDETRFASAYPCDDAAFPGKRKLGPEWPDSQKLQQRRQYEELFFALLAAAGQRGAVACLQAKGRLLELLALLRENAGLTGATATHSRRALHRALELIRRDIRRNWSLAELAHQSGIGRSQLCQSCREQTGLTIGQYLQKERIQAARFALLYTDRTLKEIADDCGFAGVQHFSRLFKAAAGLPPGAFRSRFTNLDD